MTLFPALCKHQPLFLLFLQVFLAFFWPWSVSSHIHIIGKYAAEYSRETSTSPEWSLRGTLSSVLWTHCLHPGESLLCVTGVGCAGLYLDLSSFCSSLKTVLVQEAWVILGLFFVCLLSFLRDAFPLFCNVHCPKNLFFLIVSIGSLNLVPLNPFQPEQDFLIYDFILFLIDTSCIFFHQSHYSFCWCQISSKIFS